MKILHTTLAELRELGVEIDDYRASRTTREQAEKIVMPCEWPEDRPPRPHHVVQRLIALYRNSRNKS